MAFGTVLRAARDRVGKTARQLEAEADLPHGTISRWERARASGAYPRGEVTVRLAQALDLSADWQRALELAAILDLLARYGFVSDTRDTIVRSAYECARSFFEQGCYRNAEPYFVLADAQLGRHSTDNVLRWEVGHELGITLAILGRISEARHQFYDGVRLAHELHDEPREARATNNLGVMEWCQGKRVEAFHHHRFAADYWRSRAANGQQLLACALRDQATALKRMADSNQVFALLKESLEVAERAGDLDQTRLTLSELARCSVIFAKFEEARAAYEQFDSLGSWPVGTYFDVLVQIPRLAAAVHMGDLTDPVDEANDLLAICEANGYGASAAVVKNLIKPRSPRKLREFACTIM